MTNDQMYSISGLNRQKRSAMCKYFGRITEDERVEAFRLAYDLYQQKIEEVKEQFRGKPELFYSLVCLALWKMNWTRVALAKKSPNLTGKQAKEISQRRIASALSSRKDRMKRGRLSTIIDVRLYDVVKTLRKIGLSWRESAEYIQKHHRIKISHVHLYKLYSKITNEKKTRGEE